MLNHDQAGNLTEVTDEGQNIVGRARYDAFGTVLMSTIPPTLTGRLPANGQLDAAAGLVYAGDGRWYDPALGLHLQPDPLGGAPAAPGSLNRYAALESGPAPLSALSSRARYRHAVDSAVDLGFLSGGRWWTQQSVGQTLTYGASRLAEYSLMRFTVSASRRKLLTRLPARAIDLLGGKGVIESLPANRTLHTLGTGGLRLVRGSALPRSAFDDLIEVAAGDGRSTRWAGTVGDDYLSHSFSWLGSRWFGATLAGVGDLTIQWFWPGSGDVWNYQEYGLTPGQFIGRGAVAVGGGLLAWGAAGLVGIIAAPYTLPFLASAGIFIFVEAVYEWQVKPRLYEWLNLRGTGEH
jgi:hypothetical protein